MRGVGAAVPAARSKRHVWLFAGAAERRAREHTRLRPTFRGRRGARCPTARACARAASRLDASRVTRGGAHAAHAACSACVQRASAARSGRAAHPHPTNVWPSLRRMDADSNSQTLPLPKMNISCECSSNCAQCRLPPVSGDALTCALRGGAHSALPRAASASCQRCAATVPTRRRDTAAALRSAGSARALRREDSAHLGKQLLRDRLVLRVRRRGCCRRAAAAGLRHAVHRHAAPNRSQ
jgi:hypothetical protein